MKYNPKDSFRMILVDFSSMVHRHLYNSINAIKPQKKNNKYKTADFIDYWKFLMLDELFRLPIEYNGFGDVVLCLDDFSKRYWRKDVFSNYKSGRSIARTESDIDFKEFFELSNVFVDSLKLNSPWKFISFESAEADDVIFVLSKEFSNDRILIYSPDKDFIQCQRYSNNVTQYSPITRKYITADTKASSMEKWITEHICLGDSGDGVPRIIDETEFSDSFKLFISTHNLHLTEFVWHKLASTEKTFYDTQFTDWATKNNLEVIIFKKHRFGISGLNKKIEEYGSLKNWLKSDQLLELNYIRNYTLVMAEGIPDYVKTGIMNSFNENKNQFVYSEFEIFLKKNNLRNIVSSIPPSLKPEIDADFFDSIWWFVIINKNKRVKNAI